MLNVDFPRLTVLICLQIATQNIPQVQISGHLQEPKQEPRSVAFSRQVSFLTGPVQ